MADPTEIIQKMKIDVDIPERNPLPEIVKYSAPPTTGTELQTNEEINAVLSHYGLPTMDEDATLREQLDVLVSLERQGILLSLNCAELQAHMEKVEKYKEIEANCDQYEIEMANRDACNDMKYKDVPIDELRNLVAQKCKDYAMIQALSSSDIARVNEMLHSKDIIRMSEFLDSIHGETADIAVYAKAVDLLQSRQDEWCRAVSLVISGVTSVEDLGTALGVDRVGVLRVIYQLCSKGILDYDRLADTVCIATNQE